MGRPDASDRWDASLPEMQSWLWLPFLSSELFSAGGVGGGQTGSPSLCRGEQGAPEEHLVLP